ncbi:hypothetical protein ABT061_44035 [Streptosporangium sp. NPDC002544]|uniref:hypothetical protein n=1 Tax=Streptosporangium sp. NPDC002544 TaxID=3154538 RepID=UPI00332AB7C7
MEIIPTDEMDWKTVVANARVGDVQNKYVREGEVLPGVGYAADCYNYVGGENVFTAPRHRHDFEQIRISMTGVQDFGRGQVTEEGWIAYFPAGAYYGPERIDGASIFQIQWSDAWVSRAAHDKAYAELKEKGVFSDGKYVYTDENGESQTKDALNAIWEHVYRRPAASAIPAPRYPDPILMNPDAFEYVSDGDGLSTKALGRFTERDLTITKIRWDAAVDFEMPADRTYCLFTNDGEIAVGDGRFGRHTVVWSDLGETVRVTGDPGTEALCIAFPSARFASLVADHG